MKNLQQPYAPALCSGFRGHTNIGEDRRGDIQTSEKTGGYLTNTAGTCNASCGFLPLRGTVEQNQKPNMERASKSSDVTNYWRITAVAMNISQATWITTFEFSALVAALIYAAALASNSFFADGKWEPVRAKVCLRTWRGSTSGRRPWHGMDPRARVACPCIRSHLMLPQHSSQHRTTFLPSSSHYTSLSQTGNRSGGARAPTDAFTLAIACLAHVMPRDAQFCSTRIKLLPLFFLVGVFCNDHDMHVPPSVHRTVRANCLAWPHALAIRAWNSNAGMFKTLAECDSQVLMNQWISSQAFAAQFGIYEVCLAIVTIL